MSLATDLQGIETKTGTLEKDLGDIKSTLTEKKVKDVDNIKISDVDEKILEIKSGGTPAEVQPDVFYNLSEYTENIVFTDEKAPDGVEVIDCSYNRDDSVKKWVDEKTNTLYISSQVKGKRIFFPGEDFVTRNPFSSLAGTNSTNTITKKIDLTNLSTSNMKIMGNFFWNCTALTDIVFGDFDTSNVETMMGMFANCQSLTTLDISFFDSSRLGITTQMFSGCTNLKTINFGNFKPNEHGIQFGSMFEGCSNLTNIYAPEWTEKGKNYYSNVFKGCVKLPNYDANNVGSGMALWVENGGYFTKPNTWEINKPDIIETLQGKGVTVEDSLVLSEVDEKIREIKSVVPICKQYVFEGAEYTKNVVFTDQEAPVGTATTDFSKKGNGSVVKWIDSNTDTTYISTQVEGLKIVLPQTCVYMFNYKTGISDTNNVTTSIDFSNVDTSSVTNMSYMFYYCKALIALDLSFFNTSSVTIMTSMFYQCKELITLDLSSFDTSSVKSMSSMFYYCSNLTTIYAKEWGKISDDNDMFRSCSQLPGFNSSNINSSYAKWVENGGYFTKPNTWEINKPDIIEALTEKNITVDDSLTLNEVAYKIRLIKVQAPSAVYGVKITESTSDPKARVGYTDDAVGMTPVQVDQSTGTANYNGWNKTWIFNKIYPCMVKSNGQIDYELDPNDYSKKLEGGNSDVGNTSYDGNAMVCVEKFYTKFSMSGSNECIQISDLPKDGFEPIGFIRADGTEADRIFLPMFMGSFDSSSKLRSISGQNVKYNTSFTDFRTAAQKNGSNYDIETWAMNQMFQAVYYILMKNCNPKTALGDGRQYSGAKTGILNNKGPIAYDPSTKTVKFMHMEDFTSNHSNSIYRSEAGILSTNNKIYVKMKPPYSGSSTSGYTEVSDHVGGNNYLSKMKCDNKYGRYGVEYNGSDSTYEASYWYTKSSNTLSISQRGAYFGVAGRRIQYSASYPYSNIGAALSLLPPA